MDHLFNLQQGRQTARNPCPLKERRQETLACRKIAIIRISTKPTGRAEVQMQRGNWQIIPFLRPDPLSKKIMRQNADTVSKNRIRKSHEEYSGSVCDPSPR